MDALSIDFNHGEADIARERFQAAGETEDSPDIGPVDLVSVEVPMTVPAGSIRARMPG